MLAREQTGIESLAMIVFTNIPIDHPGALLIISILRNVIIKDEPVICPCFGQCRTQICCKAKEEADNNETSISTSDIVLASIVLVLLLVIVGALVWVCWKKWVCCKGNKGN